MKRFLILIITLISCSILMAQLSIRRTKAQIEGALISYYNTVGSDVSFLPTYKQRAFTFGFAIGIDKKGKIDTVIFSNQTKKLDSLVSFNTITQRLKTITGLQTHKNTTIVGIVLIRRSQDDAVTNFYDPYMRRQFDEMQDFDEYFTGTIPNIPAAMQNRKMILMPAFGLVQVEAKH